MAGRRSFGAEADDDGRACSAQKADDIANELRGLELMQRSVAIAGKLDGLDSEDARRCPRLVFPDLGQFLARRNGDAGVFSSVPVRCAKQISADSRGRVPGD